MQGRGGPAPFEHVGGTMGDLWARCAAGAGGGPLSSPWAGRVRGGLWGDWWGQIEAGCLPAMLPALSDPAPAPPGKAAIGFFGVRVSTSKGQRTA